MTRPTPPQCTRPSPRGHGDDPPASEASRSRGASVDLDAAVGERDVPRGGAAGVLRLGELSDLPASVSLLEAARALGIGRTSAYNLARLGQFPCPLIKVGALYRVPTAGLLQLLGLTPAHSSDDRSPRLG